MQYKLYIKIIAIFNKKFIFILKIIIFFKLIINLIKFKFYKFPLKKNIIKFMEHNLSLNFKNTEKELVTYLKSY